MIIDLHSSSPTDEIAYVEIEKEKTTCQPVSALAQEVFVGQFYEAHRVEVISVREGLKDANKRNFAYAKKTEEAAHKANSERTDRDGHARWMISFATTSSCKVKCPLNARPRPRLRRE